jgi:hypothetical protein
VTAVQHKTDLWSLVWGRPEVDPVALAQAIEAELMLNSRPDHRTRLLVRDGTDALEQHWGREAMAKWLEASPARGRIEEIRSEKFDETGFPSLREQMVESTRAETVRQYFRDLSTRVHGTSRLNVGGAIALILSGHLSRATTDIDVVDEVPAELREERRLLAELKKRYRLELTHFQSHFLPSGWESRLHFLDSFGQLQVYLVDVYDTFLCKLFSQRAKDLDDLRALSPTLEKATIVQRLHDTTQAMQGDPRLRQQAEKNWYILYGDSFPT